MTEKKSKVPVVTLEKGDKDSAKEFKGTGKGIQSKAGAKGASATKMARGGK